VDPGDYTACDATELRGLLAAGEVDEAEVREAALRALAAVEPRLNAVVSGPYEDARASPDGPLAGVPFAVKDTLPEAGRPLGFGSRLLDGYVARREATLSGRFRDSGLVSLVRSATPEFAFNTDTAPLVHGPTLNPWDLSRSPGGSSGGAAALVAAGVLPMAHGNDGGGSIRVPAAWCGLVGLKPSRGRVPLGPAVGEAVSGFAHEFALTRTVRDTAALLDAVNGPAPGDRYYVERPQRSYVESLAIAPPALRVAVCPGALFDEPVDAHASAAVEQVASTLEGLGHQVEEALPQVDEGRLRGCLETVWSVDLAGLASTFERIGSRQAGPDAVEAASRACIRRGRELSALELEAAASTVNSISRRWGNFLEEYQLFVCPTTPGPAPASGVPDQADERYDTAAAWINAVFGPGPFTPLMNLTGQPSISLPLGQTPAGLPIGVMLTAQMLREDLLLQVSAALEQAMPWRERRPAVHAAP
jgi:amidase